MNSSDKLLSVIVPSYNMEEYLPKCLGSLIVPDKDLLQLLDVIVVNDGSKDRTSEIAHQYEHDYPGVFRVIDKTNGNYGSCINSALPMAVGFYIKVLDSDDSVDTEAFCSLLSVLSAEIIKDGQPPDLVISDYVTVSPDGGIIDRISYPFPQGEGRSLLDMPDGQQRFTLHSIVYKRSVLFEIDYAQSEGVSYSDSEWIIEPMVRVSHVLYVPVPVVKYLIGRTGQTMETKTLISRYTQFADITIGLASRYNMRIGQCLPTARTYYERQILRMVELVYHACMFGFGNGKFKVCCDLSAFDRQLRICPAIWKKAGEICFRSKRFPFHYVKAWRNGFGWMSVVAYKIICVFRAVKRAFVQCKKF